MRRLKRIGWPGGVAAGVLLLAAATAMAALLVLHSHSRSGGAQGAVPHSSDSAQIRFAYLSQQHSNRCGMPASALESMRAGSHLQGSCCFPMDYGAYVNQRHELTRYADVAVIPKDPYDISVSLAKRLIGYQSIKLSPAEQRIYNRAKPLSTTKGPCCCPCWRWTAFGGQAKYLITRRHYSAQQIADVWSFEEGCGGPAD